MTSQPIVHELLGLSGYPDSIRAAIAKVHLPCGVEPDDIAQLCRLQVAMAATRYEAGKGKPFSFAYGIARMEALSFLRGHGRRVKRLEPLLLQLSAASVSMTAPKPAKKTLFLLINHQNELLMGAIRFRRQPLSL